MQNTSEYHKAIQKSPKKAKKCQKTPPPPPPPGGGGVSLYKRLDMHFFARTAGRGAAL